MSILTQTPDLDTLAETVRIKKRSVAECKYLYMTGEKTYDDLKACGESLCAAMFAYSRAKFPSVKPRRISYMSVIR